MPSASAKVLSRLHFHEPTSDSAHTEQPDRRRDVQLESLTSEQHRTWSRAAGHGQHARKRAMGWMRCKRTPCRSFSSLSPAVVLSQRLLLGFPHTAGAFWVFGSGAGGDGDGIGSGEGNGCGGLSGDGGDGDGGGGLGGGGGEGVGGVGGDGDGGGNGDGDGGGNGDSSGGDSGDDK